MIKFLFAHIIKNPIRSLSIIGSIGILLIMIMGSFFLQKNITSAIEYYATHGNNEKRITLSGNQNLMNIFNADSGMQESLIQEIIHDEFFEDIQIFRLVHIPVSAKFGFFSFNMESDIPVFSVSDSVLSGASIPVGMSRTMIDLYNTQFAGSSSLFPQMKDSFLLGQKIEFTFGKSKIFQSSNTIAKPIIGTITTINNDFPGLGLVLPESIIKEKLQETGYQLGSPYKIVGYVKDMSNKQKIENKYKHITTRFEIDEIHKTKQKILFIKHIFLSINTFVLGFFGIFFAFLLGGYFRERKNIFEIISLFGLKNLKSYFLTLGEPFFFSILGIGIGGLTSYLSIKFFSASLKNILEARGFLFPILHISGLEILTSMLIFLVSIGIFLGILEYFARQKYKFPSK